MRFGSRVGIVVSALGIGVFEVAGTFGAAHNQPDRRSIDALALALVLLGPAALAVRDRWPRTAVVVTLATSTAYVALGYPYGPIFVGVVVALVWSILAGHRVATWCLGAAGVVAYGVANALDHRSQNNPWVHLALVTGWLVVVLVAADLWRVRREQIAAREQADRDARLRHVADQRVQLAQELHDVLAHNISLVNVQASVALHLLDEQPERAKPALTAIKVASHEALEELRAALDLLRDDGAAPRAPSPRLADIATLVDTVRASGLDVRLDMAEVPLDLDEPVQLAAYRIVQEALTNVTRHAHAARAEVALGYHDGVLTVTVSDNGVGGAPPVAGNGLVGMRERAAALGGHVDAGPRNGGFVVVGRLPTRRAT
jgi:signal transduction histidine kinase